MLKTGGIERDAEKFLIAACSTQYINLAGGVQGVQWWQRVSENNTGKL